MATSATTSSDSATITISASRAYTYTATPGAGGSIDLFWTSNGTDWNVFRGGPFRKTQSGAVPIGAVGVKARAYGAAGSFDAAASSPNIASLITTAAANLLVPGQTYVASDGVVAVALTPRYLQPVGPWFADGRRWSVGANTSAVDLTYCTLPPLAPNAQVDIWSTWLRKSGATNNVRARIYLGGTVGGGLTGATAIYVRNINSTSNDKVLTLRTQITNQNDAAAQQLPPAGDSTTFSISTSALVNSALNTDAGILLKTLGETSKTGSNVTITNLVSSGTTATATAAGHGLTTGAYVGVASAADSKYNVDPAQVTVVDANTFTYTIAAGATTPDIGSPVFQEYSDLSLVSLRVNLWQFVGF